MTAEAYVTAAGVHRVLPGPVPVTLVRDIELSINAGEFVVVTGPSGSGKSSLLYLLGLLDRPTQGEILIEGKPTGGLSRDAAAALRLGAIGFVFQFHFLLPEFSALENVMLPMRRLGALEGPAMQARGRDLLAKLEMADYADRRPEQLSGGQRQRVAIARALANAPRLVLADEPTGNLDSHNAQQVFAILADLARTGRAVVAVTHNLDLATKASRRITLLDGRIVEDERTQ
ncbi:MAG: ABC transporter ATP-binding protein [Defluviicoccus sp.]